MIKQRLFTPGPTDVPAEVLIEMAKPIFHHRTARFKEMFAAVNDGLKKLFLTSNDVLTIAGSGTAGMEAAMACAIPRDKKVLVAQGGKFAERWVKVAKAYNMQARRGEGRVGHGHFARAWSSRSSPPAATARWWWSTARPRQRPRAICRPSRTWWRGTDAILIADCITSAGTLPLKTDEWGVDIVVTGSQKALMLPPGLALLSVSPKAWAIIEKVAAPGVYLSLKAYKKSLLDSDVPYTPAITLIRGLQVSLEMIHKIGVEKIWSRTALLARAVREAMKAHGLKVYSRQPSDSVTGIMYPEGVEDKKFRNKVLRDKWGARSPAGRASWKARCSAFPTWATSIRWTRSAWWRRSSTRWSIAA